MGFSFKIGSFPQYTNFPSTVTISYWNIEKYQFEYHLHEGARRRDWWYDDAMASGLVTLFFFLWQEGGYITIIYDADVAVSQLLRWFSQ